MLDSFGTEDMSGQLQVIMLDLFPFEVLAYGSLPVAPSPGPCSILGPSYDIELNA
jgi:hypothetical protein